MAVEEQAAREFSEILSTIQRKFEVIHAKWTENKFFEAKFRTQISRSSEDFNSLCDEWVDLFSEGTNTVWVKKISNTGPKIRFRKQYQCWTQEGKVVQKELLFDARRCKGTLDVKVLTDNPQTRRKNKHIKLGLNVVVKINFTHLHPVDINRPFAFFVHTCEPLLAPPKLMVQPNDNLPKLIADMIQKGLNASPKVVNTTYPLRVPFIPTNITKTESNDHVITNSTIMTFSEDLKRLNDDQKRGDLQSQLTLQDNFTQIENDNLLQNLQVQNLEGLQLGHVVPMQNMDPLKMELQPHMPSLTQVVVSTPQMSITEPLLMCQPTVMFDTSVIPVNHQIPHHYVQVNAQNIQSQHYL